VQLSQTQASPNLIDQSARLVEFLRQLATVRQSTVSDVAQYEMVCWLDDLPTSSDVLMEAGPGEVALSVDAVTSEPPPPVPASLRGQVQGEDLTNSDLEEPRLVRPHELNDESVASFRFWIDQWQVWAEADRRVAKQRGWHKSLLQAARKLDQHDDEYELVLATGLLSWDTPGNGRIFNHLLHAPARTVVDDISGRVDVLIDPEAVARLSDRDLLHGTHGFESAAADAIRRELRGTPAVPLGDDTKQLLTEWRRLALDHCHEYEHVLRRPSAPATAATLTFAPALVLRKRDQQALIQYYDRMLEALSGPDAAAPLGLAQLLTPLEAEERLDWLTSEGASSGSELGSDPLFPLPANPEQRQIMDRLRGDNGVVVQGPPGTGKTHTIANLISALLARGQRVLVTSQKGQALRVLHDKLPAEVQQLCVSLTDVKRGGSSELDRSVAEISRRFDGYSPEATQRQIHDLATRRHGERQRVSHVKEQIRALREAETYQHGEIASGYRGTLARIVEQVQLERPSFSWFSTPMPASAPPQAPLTAGEAIELVHLLVAATPQRESRRDQFLPDLGTLPGATEIGALVGAESAAAGRASAAESAMSAQLSRLDETMLASLEHKIADFHRALADAGLAGDRITWPNDWRHKALADYLAGRDTAVWQHVASLHNEITTAQSMLQATTMRDVTLPTFDDTGSNSLVGQLSAAQELRTEFAGGYRLKKRFKSDAQKRAELILEHALVDGSPAVDVERLDVIIARLGAEQRCRTLSTHWAVVGVNIEPSLPVLVRLARLLEAANALEHIHRAIELRDELIHTLTGRQMPIPLRSIDEWQMFTDALEGVRLRLQAEQATLTISQQQERLVGLTKGAGVAPPEALDLLQALDERDVDAYHDALQDIARAHQQQQDQQSCDELLSRFGHAHPALAAAIADSATDPDWERRLARLPEAWAWATAATFVDAQRDPGLEARLEADLDDATARTAQLTAELAAAEAWGQCLSRMNARQAQALRAYQQLMSDRGKGSGKWAHRFERSARDAMFEARDAVPGWIMPLAEVLHTIPPDPNSFDVVIVDEASQAGLDALFLLWLAPRVIVVGDDRQCTPSQVSHGALQPIFDKLDDHLSDVPEYLRLSFTPKSSLFSLLSTRFGSVVRLREHFRCMPEIIDWSSRQFYSDQPLVPLRQYGADRLPPLKTSHVADAYTEGANASLTNRVEAAAIVSQIVACTQDPAYDGKTFGVVVLQGSGQVRLIDSLLETALDTDERERRRLRVGIAPDFQGDERHVVFLSMVVAESRRAMTAQPDQRRFNVAASRAQDQLWLFHSVTPDLLSPDDLRRSLLSYMVNPPAPRLDIALDDVVPDAKHPSFDSLFEQRVFLHIKQRGFLVTPQYEVNGRRIDLVITGTEGRLAVECDGDAWHSSPEQRAADFERELELKRAGWEFWRVRESEFYYDSVDSLADLWQTLERRGINPGLTGTSGKTTNTTVEWTAIPLSDEDNPSPELPINDSPVRSHATSTRDTTHRASARADAVTVTAAATSSVWSASANKERNHTDAATTASDMRSWARANGFGVGERGRLAPAIINAWNATHPDRIYQP
jgi:very-short-patch-repair endonuclease